MSRSVTTRWSLAALLIALLTLLAVFNVGQVVAPASAPALTPPPPTPTPLPYPEGFPRVRAITPQQGSAGDVIDVAVDWNGWEAGRIDPATGQPIPKDVFFGTVPAQTVSTTATGVRVRVPEIGPGRVADVTFGGVSFPDVAGTGTFRYAGSQPLTLSPNAGVFSGGGEVTMTSPGLDFTDVTRAVIGWNDAQILSRSSSALVIKVPPAPGPNPSGGPLVMSATLSFANASRLSGGSYSYAPPGQTPQPTSTGLPPTPSVTPTPVITNPVAVYNFALSGSTQLKTLTTGTVSLAGKITGTELNLSTGDFTTDLALNNTRAKLTVAGLIPVTANIAFVPSGKTTGSLKSGVLRTSSKVKIRLPQIYLFGAIQIAGGNCQTRQYSTIDLESTQERFQPLVGGPVAGTYAISDLTGCGALNGIISPLTAGCGNTINLNLTPLT